MASMIDSCAVYEETGHGQIDAHIVDGLTHAINDLIGSNDNSSHNDKDKPALAIDCEHCCHSQSHQHLLALLPVHQDTGTAYQQTNAPPYDANHAAVYNKPFYRPPILG